jgi:hypothetical protein
VLLPHLHVALAGADELVFDFVAFLAGDQHLRSTGGRDWGGRPLTSSSMAYLRFSLLYFSATKASSLAWFGSAGATAGGGSGGGPMTTSLELDAPPEEVLRRVLIVDRGSARRCARRRRRGRRAGALVRGKEEMDGAT